MATPDLYAGLPIEIVHVSHRSRMIWPDVDCERCGIKLLPGMLSVRDEKDFVFVNLPPGNTLCERVPS